VRGTEEEYLASTIGGFWQQLVTGIGMPHAKEMRSRDGSAVWPRYHNRSADGLMLFDTKSRGGSRWVEFSPLQRAKCQFWDSFIELAPQT
jgi:hypothetical protein